MFMQPSASALNHLLAQNDGAFPRLARFAGKTARFDIAPFSFAYTIQQDGTLRGADTSVSADAVCVIALSLMPRLALHDEKAYADILAQGDAALLTEIFSLSRSLHWDAAKDLNRIAGDNVTERIMSSVQEKSHKLHDLAANLSKMASEYFTEEHPLLAKPNQVAEFIRQVDEIRDDVARLEQRVKLVARDH